MRKGIRLGLLLHLLQFAFAPVVLGVAVSMHPEALLRAAIIALISIGVTQSLYILPVMHVYQKRGDPDTVKGLAATAAGTFALCALIGAGAFALHWL